MNKRGQEINPIGILMGIVGGAFAFWMAGSMGSGTIMRGFTGIATAVVCYFMASYIINK